MSDKKSNITLCLLARNEKHNLDRCFSNIGEAVDRILLLDTGSTDGTAEKAVELGAEVYRYTWDNDFSKARNSLLEKVETGWVLWIDGDEHYSESLTMEILEVTKSDTGHAGYRFPRKNFYFGKWMKYGRNYPDLQLKLFRKEDSGGYRNRIHEKAVLNGSTGVLKNAIEHHPYPTVDSYMIKFYEYTSLEAKKLYENEVDITFINTLKWMFFKPVFRFIKRYFLYGGFMNGIPGAFAAFFDAAGFVVRYVKLGELKNSLTK